MTLHGLLDFWSGPSDETLIGHTDTDPITGRMLVDPMPIYRREKPAYSVHDLVRALVAEVRKLRGGES